MRSALLTTTAHEIQRPALFAYPYQNRLRLSKAPLPDPRWGLKHNLHLRAAHNLPLQIKTQAMAQLVWVNKSLLCLPNLQTQAVARAPTAVSLAPAAAAIWATHRWSLFLGSLPALISLIRPICRCSSTR